MALMSNSTISSNQDSADGSWSLSYDIGLQALSAMIGRQLRAFHQVMLRDGIKMPTPSTKDPKFVEVVKEGAAGVDKKKAEKEKEKDEKAYPVLYFCLSKTEVILVLASAVDDALLKEFAIKAAATPKLRKTGPVTAAKDPLLKNPHELLCLPFSALHRVLVDAQREDFVDIFLIPEKLKEFDIDISPFSLRLEFSTMYRKALIEDLEVCYNSDMMARSSEMSTLSVAFSEDTGEDPLLDGCRHPVEQYFHRLPEVVRRDKQVFFRFGYVFLAPRDWIDTYAMLHNRPCSTYHRPKVRGGQALERLERMVIRLMPQQPISRYTSLTRSRDARGRFYRPDEDENKSPMATMAIGRDNCSDLDFQLWVENCAMTIAMQESAQRKSKDYFVADRGVYHKKMNVVGDKAAWTGFRVHLFTKNREIGVIGLRRNYIPPYFDSYQDMLFVFYSKWEANYSPDPLFLPTLDAVADSFSPVVTPLPYRDFIRKENVGRVHRTYIDRQIIQSRCNTLLYNAETFAWLKNRNWIKWPNQTGPVDNHHTGIFPRTLFIDMECHTLGQKFCLSILAKCHPRGEESKKGTAATAPPKAEMKAMYISEATVEDPLSIVPRMQAEMATDDPLDTPEEAEMKREEWKCRVSAYFAYCADGGLYPPGVGTTNCPAGLQLNHYGHPLTIRRLVEANPSHSPEAYINMLDQVVDFLLYMRRSPAVYSPTGPVFVYEPSSTIMDKVRAVGFLGGYTCNEHVMIRLLETDYFEKLFARKNLADDPVDLLAQFFCSLIAKDYNLDLIRAVCEKIVSLGTDDGLLVAPLTALIKKGSLYAKIHAFRALTALAIKRKNAIYDSGGLGLAVWHIYVSKSAVLLQVCCELLLNCIDTSTFNSKNKLCRSTDFAKQLVQLLRVRCKANNCRYPNPLLGVAATLISKMSVEETSLDTFLRAKVYNELVAIAHDYEFHKQIIVQVTACLGTLYVNSGPKMLKYSENAWSHAKILMNTLKHSQDDLNEILNILIALRSLVKLSIEMPAGTTFTERHGYLTARYHILRDLKLNGFDNVLENFVRGAAEGAVTAVQDYERARSEIWGKQPWKVDKKEDDRMSTKSRFAAAIKKKIVWFTKRIAQGMAQAGDHPKREWALPPSRLALDAFIKSQKD